MNDTYRAMRPAAAILICASIMLTLSMGLRQSLGLFMQPMTRDIALTVSEFTFAIAIQNLAWGLAQPFTGALVVRLAFRHVMVAGGVLYVLGLACLAMAQGIAFFSHQMGSFLGAFGGGMVYDAFGSYELAWRFGVGLGLVAGVVQVAFALMRPPAAMAH